MDFLPVGNELERHFRPDEGDAQELLDDGPQFRIVGLEELAAGRHVEEEVADGEVAAFRGGDRLCPRRFRFGNLDLGADFVFFAARSERDFGHGRDRGQRLAAEAVSQNPLEVFGRVDLAGGVAREAEHRLVGRHAAAVVDDLDERLAGVAHRDADAFRARVHGVLHQLLHHGGGARDHLTGGDQVRDILREYLEHLFYWTSSRMKPFER